MLIASQSAANEMNSFFKRSNITATLAGCIFGLLQHSHLSPLTLPLPNLPVNYPGLLAVTNITKCSARWLLALKRPWLQHVYPLV